MHLKNVNHRIGSNALKYTKTLLVVGPQPPPVGGGTISVQLLLDELAGFTAIKTIAINTSPHNYAKKRSLLKLGMSRRTLRIATQYIKNIRNSDAVLVVASARGQFLFTLGCVFLLLARQYRVPFYLKPQGSVLSRRLKACKKPIRSFILMVLRAATCVLVETQQLQTELARMGCINTCYVPNCRPLPPEALPPKRTQGEFRLIFLSQIERRKGPLLLLEALRILEQKYNLNVDCDFYGPILGEDREDFFSQLELTTRAQYCGVAQTETISRLLQGYDALVFPTYYVSEGHPGVIIEAMQSGIPVISAQYQAVNELITNGENGFLVPMGDVNALVSAIKQLMLDGPLREKMGKANFQKGQEFRSDIVISRMIEIIFP